MAISFQGSVHQPSLTLSIPGHAPHWSMAALASVDTQTHCSCMMMSMTSGDWGCTQMMKSMQQATQQSIHLAQWNGTSMETTVPTQALLTSVLMPATTQNSTAGMAIASAIVWGVMRKLTVQISQVRKVSSLVLVYIFLFPCNFSDETDCEILRADSSYLKDVPPPPPDDSHQEELIVDIDILSILDIVEVDNVFSLQLRVGLTWLDRRLSLIDLHEDDNLNTLTSAFKNKIWLPQVNQYTVLTSLSLQCFI